MKKIMFIMCAVFCLFSCKEEKKAEPAPVVTEPVVSEQISEPAPVVHNNLPGVILHTGADVCQKNDKGKMQVVVDSGKSWYLPAGTVVEVCVDADTGDVLPPETCLRASDNASREYYKIVYKGKECYTQTYFLGVNCVPGVVVRDESFLYADESALKPSSYTLPKFKVVGVNLDMSTKKSVCISAYMYDWYVQKLSHGAVIQNEYMKAATVSTDEDDFTAADLYVAASAASNLKQKKEIISNALDLEKNSFREDFQAMFDSLDKWGNFEYSKYSSDEKAKVSTDDGGRLRVRQYPDTEEKLIASLDDGTVVTVTGCTLSNDTIAGEVNRWYKISAPVDGWVWGACLDLNYRESAGDGFGGYDDDAW